MLRIPADFPAAGAKAFLAPHAEPVRIMRHNDNGTVLVAREREGASGNTEVARATLHATEEAAIGTRPTRARRRA